MAKPRILVHFCCAPDALYVAGLLREEYEVAGFFYNPNIQPEDEYRRRLQETQKIADLLKLELIIGPYDEVRWMKLAEKFRDEPEKGRRCDVCYSIRLGKTAEEAAGGGFEFFTTVMSLSPWKKAEVLNRIGRMFAARHRLRFLEANFKKKDGFRKSLALSRSRDLYRQNYCGCLYSRKKADGKS